ncbi:hypothetical protein Ocin01_13549 [Orchesella cincta]|uniref:Uncharacterized protein n=1 Tax=Orchesella cincta TaxID=48709 RepID=A0A1D2MJP4_ORCCI|nr:hypothetical protein Ocin01_13549 [Orchesella cincta]
MVQCAQDGQKSTLLILTCDLFPLKGSETPNEIWPRAHYLIPEMIIAGHGLTHSENGERSLNGALTNHLTSCCPKSSRAFVVIAVAIWIELGCGLVASVWTVLFNDRLVDIWAYIIFAVDLAFALGLFYCTGQLTWSRLKRNPVGGKEQSASLNWIFVICTLFTFGLFAAVLCYNGDVLVGKGQSNKLLHGVFGMYASVALLLPFFYMVFSASPLTLELFPFIILVTSMQMGTGLALTTYTAFFNHKKINVWAYILFGIEIATAVGLFYKGGREICSRLGGNSSAKPETIFYWACGIYTVKTGFLFVIVWYYNAFVLGHISLSMVFLDSFGMYLFSLYLLTLVKCIPDDPNDSDDEGVSKYEVEPDPEDRTSVSSTQNTLTVN